MSEVEVSVTVRAAEPSAVHAMVLSLELKVP
jgi:hypothetical protein